MPPLIRRELPASHGFSVPHVQSYQGAIHFLRLLESYDVAYAARVRELGGTNEAQTQAGTEYFLERQALSEAVQVFAAITVEGALNLYCILLFGEAAFYESLERSPWQAKLKHVVSDARPERQEALANLLEIASRLSKARNSFVHPKPYEGEGSPPTGRMGDLESAQAAVKDMSDFLDGLRLLDVRYGAFFFRFPL